MTYCWYNCDKRCTQPRDCKIADRCLDCWNPAEVKAMRPGPLWFWLVDVARAALENKP